MNFVRKPISSGYIAALVPQAGGHMRDVGKLLASTPFLWCLEVDGTVDVFVEHTMLRAKPGEWIVKDVAVGTLFKESRSDFDAKFMVVPG